MLPWKKVEFDYPYASGNVPPVKYQPGKETSVWVRVQVRPKPVEGNVPDAECQLFWSTDGKRFTKAGSPFKAAPEQWTGARLGFFCLRSSLRNDCGRVDVTGMEIH